MRTYECMDKRRAQEDWNRRRVADCVTAADGTLRKPVIIWVVRLGDDLYVRSVNGRTSGWFRGVQTRHEGRIRAGGVEKDVTFVEETDPEINDQIDAAYAAKYRRYATVRCPSMQQSRRASCDHQTGAALNNSSNLQS